ncbi:hypothetical protein GOBAR_AA10006 [Gossypium barbadense]|uniref:Uncharacterized protein n=1 Tax=Gossypium barbadense TaxID=3634 RepID=A0A2P5Y4T9_GOSBA|nr:hypothetical protein GOBAR_AA10006 [Gossypium barbadense]
MDVDQSQQQNLSHSSSSSTPSQSGDGPDGGGLSPIDEDDGFSGDRGEIRSSSQYGGEYGVGTTIGHFRDRSEFDGNMFPEPRRDRSEPRALSKGKGKKHTSIGSSSGRRSSSSNLGYSDSSTSTQGFYPPEQPSYFQPSHGYPQPYGYYPPFPNYGQENQVKNALKVKVKDLIFLVIPLIGGFRSVWTSIHKLKYLRGFYLEDCSSLEIFQEILETMERLRTLELSGTVLKELPSESYWSLYNLFSAIGGACLTGRPEMQRDLHGLSSLKELDLTGRNLENLPTSIKQLPRLQELILRKCKRLKSLPELPPSLKHLDAHDCTSLEEV